LAALILHLDWVSLIGLVGLLHGGCLECGGFVR
jgi:hypothetical protein